MRFSFIVTIVMLVSGAGAVGLREERAKSNALAESEQQQHPSSLMPLPAPAGLDGTGDLHREARELKDGTRRQLERARARAEEEARGLLLDEERRTECTKRIQHCDEVNGKGVIHCG